MVKHFYSGEEYNRLYEYTLHICHKIVVRCMYEVCTKYVRSMYALLCMYALLYMYMYDTRLYDSSKYDPF